MGQLTTHVLDTCRGRPASGVDIEIYKLDGDERRKIGTATTNDDGRCDEPLLQGSAFQAGRYELIFHTGGYFDRLGAGLPEPKFLDDIVIRFGIAMIDEHYHVPLLLSAFGYSTYRGS
jgi:5-hydroxyisourate hydrolase